jgi:hypothetical protein
MTTDAQRRALMIAAGLDDHEIAETFAILGHARKSNGRWLVDWDGDLVDVTNLIESTN